MMKPSFSFPFIKPPNMIPIVDPHYLNEIDISLFKPVPEAPWIKRGAGHFIKFTDEINYTELEFNEGDTHRRGHNRDSQRSNASGYPLRPEDCDPTQGLVRSRDPPSLSTR